MLPLLIALLCLYSLASSAPVMSTPILLNPFKSTILSQSSCSDTFGTDAMFSVQIAFLSTGTAFIEIAIDPLPTKNYTITVHVNTNCKHIYSNWNNYKVNEIVFFRRSLGVFHNKNDLHCSITINNVTKRLYVIKNNPIVSYTGNSSNNEEFTVQAIPFNETFDGAYSWTDDDLYENEACYQLLKEMEQITELPDKYLQAIKDEVAKPDVFLSLTTSPERLFKLHYVLRSLDLSLITSIFITIPKQYKNHLPYRICRKLLQQFPKIQFLSASIDIGPALKVVGPTTFLKGKGKDDSILIVIDDDNVYNKRTVDTFVYFSLFYPDAAFSASDIAYMRTFAFPPTHSYKNEFLAPTYMLEGFCGFASRLKNFDSDLIIAFSRRDLNGKLTSCYQSDDIIISFALALKGCKLNTTFMDGTPFHTKNIRRDLPYYRDAFALHLLNTDEKRSDDFTTSAKYAQVMEIINEFAVDSRSEDLVFLSRDEIIERLKASYVL